MGGNKYRTKAAEFLAHAERETHPHTIAAYQTLARSYLKLLDQADRNAKADIVYEPPPEPIIVKPAEPPIPLVTKSDEKPDSEIA